MDILTSAKEIPSELKNSGYNFINIPTIDTSTFEFQQNKVQGQDDRLLILRKRASEISQENLSLLQKSYGIVIVSAIANEISQNLLLKLLNQYKTALFLIDGQSFTRIIGDDGIISNHLLTQEFLNNLNFLNVIFKASYYEIGDLNTYSFRGILIRTNSGKPVEVLENNQYYKVKLDGEEKKVIDSTGSGDIFLVSFIIRYIQTNDIRNSIHFAHKITKNHLNIMGIPSYDQSMSILSNIMIESNDKYS